MIKVLFSETKFCGYEFTIKKELKPPEWLIRGENELVITDNEAFNYDMNNDSLTNLS